MVYFNTTNENDISEAVSKAVSQNKIILKLFRINTMLSASYCHSLYLEVTGKKTTPLTSIRRGITTLCNEGKLIKTTTKIIGKYGRNECIYKYLQ